MIKVAIANDTLIALEALRRAIAAEPAYRLIWTARDGAEAVAKAARDRPDLMLMDLLMPGIDGVEATRQIMARSPCAILIVTGSVHGNTSQVFEAMGRIQMMWEGCAKERRDEIIDLVPNKKKLS